MGAAIVAKPVDPDGWYQNINYDWVGRIIEQPQFSDTKPKTSVLTPDILGRLLVADYWTCETNIERWWTSNVDNDGSLLVDVADETIDWVYIGAVDRFIVLSRRDDGWWMGAVTWAGDPADIMYQPMPVR